MVSVIPVADLLPVSTSLAVDENLRKDVTILVLPVVNLDLQVSPLIFAKQLK